MNSLIENTLDICDLTLQGVDNISCLLAVNTVSVERSGLNFKNVFSFIKKSHSLTVQHWLTIKDKEIYILVSGKLKKQIMVSKKQCRLYFIHDIISTISL